MVFLHHYCNEQQFATRFRTSAKTTPDPPQHTRDPRFYQTILIALTVNIYYVLCYVWYTMSFWLDWTNYYVHVVHVIDHILSTSQVRLLFGWFFLKWKCQGRWISRLGIYQSYSLNFKLTYLATKRNFSCQKYTVKIFFAC